MHIASKVICKNYKYFEQFLILMTLGAMKLMLCKIYKKANNKQIVLFFKVK